MRNAQLLPEKKSINSEPISIVFICSGNVIRSAYAELLFEKMVAETNCLRDRIQVHSGAVQYHNTRIYSEIIPFLIKEGVEELRIKNFKSRHVDDYPELLSDSDLILVMTNSHIRRIPDLYKDKSFLIYQYGTGEALEIPDPYFEPPMERAIRMLNKALNGLLDRLKTELCI